VEKEPTKSVAYFSPRSYPCLEAMPQNLRQSVPQGMVRIRTLMAMQKFSDSAGTVNSVADVFEPADTGSQALKPTKNAYASEFGLMSVPGGHGCGRGVRCHIGQGFEQTAEREVLFDCVSREKRRQPEQGCVPALD
jgi:hypothetical protein